MFIMNNRKIVEHRDTKKKKAGRSGKGSSHWPLSACSLNATTCSSICEQQNYYWYGLLHVCSDHDETSWERPLFYISD